MARRLWPQRLAVATMAFLTVVDLFATQALLPMLAHAYAVPPARMGLAVNACTIGMAVAGLVMSVASAGLDRRRVIMASLLLLALPTLLLATHPPLAWFAALRVAQGACMATAFTLTLAYLGERFMAEDRAGVFAAYVTGNVASNLIGRLVAAGVAGNFGLSGAFVTFAGLNLAGAALCFATIDRLPPPMRAPGANPIAIWRGMLANGPAMAACGIGFCILFAFIGVFTYVNFVLAGPPIGLGMMQLGLVYFVFLPSILTTPFAGAVTQRLGTRAALRGAFLITALGLALLLAPSLPLLLGGLMLVAVGLFLAQAIATGFVAQVAADRAAGSGLYLASYFLGGLAGTAVLGQLFDAAGWHAAITGVAVSLAVATLLVSQLKAVPQIDG